MAEKTIAKTHKNKKGEEKTILYRVDADFVPTSVNEICEEFIQNYCEAKGQVEWLIAQYEAEEEAIAKKDGKRRKAGEKYKQPKSFVSIRADFVSSFFPNILKGDKTTNNREAWLAKHKKASKK